MYIVSGTLAVYVLQQAFIEAFLRAKGNFDNVVQQSLRAKLTPQPPEQMDMVLADLAAHENDLTEAGEHGLPLVYINRKIGAQWQGKLGIVRCFEIADMTFSDLTGKLRHVDNISVSGSRVLSQNTIAEFGNDQLQPLFNRPINGLKPYTPPPLLAENQVVTRVILYCPVDDNNGANALTRLVKERNFSLITH